MSGAINILNGGTGSDQIRGGALGDTINGGTGDDKIAGGAGVDILTGGSGSDTFRFANAASSGTGANADRITDFVSGTDKMSFLALDADLVAPGRQALSYIGNSAFHATGAAELRWVSAGADMHVDIDLDGNGTADMQIVLAGLGEGSLTSGDFLL
jgi:Ca2+-binding RTX toxin-like protein